MKLHKSGVFQMLASFVSLAVFAFAAHGAERTWTGLGDGTTFADSGNWDGAVQDGDALIIENPTADTTLYLTNDLGSVDSPIRIQYISAQGEGSIRISGNPIEPSCGNAQTNIYALCELVTDFDIIFPDHDPAARISLYAGPSTTWTHNGSVYAPGKTWLRFATVTGKIYVYGDVTVPNGYVSVYGTPNNGNLAARWYFYGKCTTPKFCGDTTYIVRGATYFANKCDADTVSLRCTYTYCDAVNVLKPTAVVESFSGGDSCSILSLQGYDQTIDRLAIGYNIATKAQSGNRIEGTGSTLTMKGSVDNTTNDFRFAGSVNAVWAPLGDYKCTFRERKHTTSGRMAVKRGTMAFLGATEFSALSEIEIAAGAKFSLAEATMASPFAALKYIWLENGTTSVLAIPEGCSISTMVMVDNAPLPPGTYSGEGGTADHIVDWIEGKGVVTVPSASPRFFTGANSSRWSDPLNWSDGQLPTNDVETVIAGLNVTVPPADTNFYDLTGFSANATTPSFNIVHGGRITVDGGSLIITNVCGKARLEGDPLGVKAITSRIDVVSGFLGIYPKYHASFAIGKGGVLSMTGGNAEFLYRHGSNANFEWMLRMLGGTLDLSGDSEFTLWMSGNPAPVFGTGVVNLRDNAHLRGRGLTGGSRSRWTPAAANETLTVNIGDNSTFKSGCSSDYMGGYYDGAKTVINVSGNAQMGFNDRVYVGWMGYAELNISGNAVVSNSTNYGIIVGGESGTESNPAVGKIKMTGGLLKPIVNSNAGVYGSLNIGRDSATVFTNVNNRGTLEISGGTVKNDNTSGYSKLIVGAGNSYGEVLQSGGTMKQGKTGVFVGWRGGIGYYRFTGGTADFSQCDCNVGTEGGKGTLEIGAGTGTLTVVNLLLDGADSVLKFKPGADGSLATANVTGTFTVGEHAKLVVDATEYSGRRAIDLITFSAKSGEFAVSDIEVIAENPNGYEVQQLADRIRVRPIVGFLMIVK